MLLRTTMGSDTCFTTNGGSCLEAVSETDISVVDDEHALDVRVSLMQKEMARMQRHAHTSRSAKIRTEEERRFPLDHVQCPGKLTMRTTHMTGADYDAVVARMREIYESLSDFCDARECEQSHWAGCVLRLAAHDFMDYVGKPQSGIGGADGCIDLSDPDNAGITDCLIGTSTAVGLAKVYEDFCTQISLADFLVISAEGVMNITRENVVKMDPERQAVDFRSRFKYGRETQEDCSTSMGLMPDAERGCAAVDDTLVTNLGLNWNQSAALMGGHTLGGASTATSGYNGRWKEATASRLFDNGYYLGIVLKGWAPDVSVAGNKDRNQWRRADVGVDSEKKGYEMMLDSDMCLYYSFYLHHSDYLDFHAYTAHSQGCDCAWARPSFFPSAIAKYTSGEACGSMKIYDAGDPTADKEGDIDQDLSLHTGILDLTEDENINSGKQRMLCCGMSGGSGAKGEPFVVDHALDCGEAGQPKGPAWAAVMIFANNEDAWIEAYYEAWGIATAKGRESLLSPMLPTVPPTD
jgi:hypothetical protein